MALLKFTLVALWRRVCRETSVGAGRWPPGKERVVHSLLLLQACRNAS